MDLGWGLPGALLGALVFYLAHEGLIDDAYITLSYVQNLAGDLHWGLIPTETANTATSPLNVVLLALASWLAAPVMGGLDPVAGLAVVTVASSAAMAVWSAQVARWIGISGAWSLAVLAVVFANPFVNSALGMEVLLIAALLSGLTAQAVRGSRVGFGVLAGLVVLARLDVGVAVALVYLLTPALRRRPWVAPVTAVALALPWFVFSWLVLGSAVPTTVIIKTLQGSFGDATFANGWWLMWENDATRTAVSLAVIPAALGLVGTLALLVTGLRRRLPEHLWPLAGLGLGGAAHFGAYCLIHVPPYHWYYAPSTVALGLTAVFALGLAVRRVGGQQSRALTHAVPVVTAVVVAGLAVVSLGGRSLPWTHPVIFGNWAYAPDYLAVGEEVGELVGDATVVAPPEIGTVAYACECSMVDIFSDPGLTLPLITQRLEHSGPVTGFLLRANFLHLDESQAPREPEYRLLFSLNPPPPGVPSWRVDSPGGRPPSTWSRSHDRACGSAAFVASDRRFFGQRVTGIEPAWPASEAGSSGVHLRWPASSPRDLSAPTSLRAVHALGRPA